MKFLRKLLLIFSYGPELEDVLKKLQAQRKHELFIARSHHLSLCLKHQQEHNRSQYSEHNCDHCKLLKKFESHVVIRPGDSPRKSGDLTLKAADYENDK